MASSSAPANDTEIAALFEEDSCFPVTPLSECPHLGAVKPLPNPINTNEPCAKCKDLKENWICLSCYEVNCGRHVEGDAVQHSEKKKHPLALSFADLSVWCYGCDAYIHNPVFEEAKVSAYASKFPASQ